jgi:hypothetical protein
MNDRLRGSEMVDLERSLRALADHDCHVQAPPHVHAAVMRAWDVARPSAQLRRRRRRTGALLAIPSMAAAAVAVVVLYRAPSAPGPPEPVVAPAVVKPRVDMSAPTADADSPAEVHRLRPGPSRSRREKAAARDGLGVVLAADPILDASTTSIVRVRVRRPALVTLGIPLVEPDAGGLVDLEILVAEDGVARTIRRVVPVDVRQE